MGESLILRFYEFFNGQPVAIEQLIAYRQKVEAYIDSIGTGPYVPKLSAIKQSVTNAIKKLQSQGITDIEKLELVNDPKPVQLGEAPPPAAFVAMEQRGTLWPSKRRNPSNQLPDKKVKVIEKVVEKVVEKTPGNVVALEIPISQINTDTKRFQNRQGAFSEASAQSVAENFDPNKFDPIVVWKDPKAKKTFVLSGHSRLEGMKRRKAKTIPVRYFKGSEDKAIQFAKVEANRAANQENLIEDLAAYKLMRDGDKARNISKATKTELQKIFKGKAAKLESYSYLSERGLFVEALNQSTTSNYPYLERNAQWVGILRMQYPVISNQGEDNIFHFFYSDKSGKNIKLSKDLFFALAKKKINQLRKGESVLFPECSSEGCKSSVDKESDSQKGEGYKRLREINEQLESINEKLTSKDSTVRVTTEQEKKYLRELGLKLDQEKERILRDFDLMDKSQNSLFGGLKGKQYSMHDQGSAGKKSKSKLTKLQQAQLQDSIKAGSTVKVNSNKAKGQKKGWTDTPLFKQELESRQASLFGKKSTSLSGVSYTYTPMDLGNYKNDFHRLNSDSIVGIYGLPGHGKTTYLLMLAQYLATQGKKVLFVAREEYGRSVFDVKLKEHNIGHANLQFNKSINAEQLKAADVVFLDSVNALKLNAEGVEEIYHQYPNKLWFLILQSTKDGNFRGSQEWEHVVDVFGEISNRKLILRKNRLDPNNREKAAALQKADAITEAKKKEEIKQAVKEAVKPKPTLPATSIKQPVSISQPIAA